MALLTLLTILSSSTGRADDETNSKEKLDVKVRAYVYPLAVFTEADCLGDTPKEECTTITAEEKTEEKDRSEQTAAKKYLQSKRE